MNAKPILILSLVANLALAGGLIWTLKSKTPDAAPDPKSAAIETPAAPAPTPGASEVAATPATNSAPSQLFDWRAVESEDYRKYIANLRAIGCPEETIRDIIIADVNKLFESRRRTLASSNTNKFEFWKAGNPMAAMMNVERLEQSQALNKEKRALLKELLGVEPDLKPDLMSGVNDMMASMLDFLPAEKQSQIMDVYMGYQTKLAKSFGKGGAPDAEDMKSMQKVQKEMEAELAGILTPQEFEDYQLRMSQTAMVMRMQLASFEPSEQEFRDIFKLKKSFEDEYGLAGMYGLNSANKAEKEKADAAKKETDAKIKAVLGDDRYTEYERGQDWAYQGMHKTAERQGLGKAEANKVYDMKKVAEEEARKLRTNTSLTPEQRNAALRNIRTETENGIKSVFGQKGFESYESQAWWLKSISPDPQPQPQSQP
jgi:hypothetical protein